MVVSLHKCIFIVAFNGVAAAAAAEGVNVAVEDFESSMRDFLLVIRANYGPCFCCCCWSRLFDIQFPFSINDILLPWSEFIYSAQLYTQWKC